jgi:ABC-2 type transport system permease protein
MNIYLQELRSLRKSVLIWSVSLSLVVIFYLALYPAFSRDTAIVASMMSNLPQSVIDAIGITPETFTTVLGYFTFTMTYIILCGAVQAMNIGMGVLAKEAAGKTVDFLLTKPVTRAAVITAKLLAAMTALALTSLIFFIVSGVTAAAVSPNAFDYGMFIKVSLPLFFVQVIFAAMGFAVAAVVRKIKSVLPLSLSTVFMFFIIGLIQSALKLQDLRYLTPFKYFEFGYILAHASYEGAYVLLSAVLVAVSAAVSYVVYINKDIHAA